MFLFLCQTWGRSAKTCSHQRDSNPCWHLTNPLPWLLHCGFFESSNDSLCYRHCTLNRTHFNSWLNAQQTEDKTDVCWSWCWKVGETDGWVISWESALFLRNPAGELLLEELVQTVCRHWQEICHSGFWVSIRKIHYWVGLFELNKEDTEQKWKRNTETSFEAKYLTCERWRRMNEEGETDGDKIL